MKIFDIVSESVRKEKFLTDVINTYIITSSRRKIKYWGAEWLRVVVLNNLTHLT